MDVLHNFVLPINYERVTDRGFTCTKKVESSAVLEHVTNMKHHIKVSKISNYLQTSKTQLHYFMQDTQCALHNATVCTWQLFLLSGSLKISNCRTYSRLSLFEVRLFQQTLLYFFFIQCM